MPRIYAINEGSNNLMGAVGFLVGVGVLPYGTPCDYFTAEGYGVDNNKHERGFFDDLTSDQLKTLAGLLGATVDEDDTKQTIVRALETTISTDKLGGVTVDASDLTITITGEGTYKSIIGTSAAAPLYLDDVGNWNSVQSGDTVAAGNAGKTITVAKVDTSGLVLALGSAVISAT